jgi:hypothetical protein
MPFAVVHAALLLPIALPGHVLRVAADLVDVVAAEAPGVDQKLVVHTPVLLRRRADIDLHRIVVHGL